MLFFLTKLFFPHSIYLIYRFFLRKQPFAFFYSQISCCEYEEMFVLKLRGVLKPIRPQKWPPLQSTGEMANILIIHHIFFKLNKFVSFKWWMAWSICETTTLISDLQISDHSHQRTIFFLLNLLQIFVNCIIISYLCLICDHRLMHWRAWNDMKSK